MEGDTGSGEKVKIHNVKAPEKSWFGRVTEQVYNKWHPEVTRLRERLPWIDELKLPQKALEWIGECKELSDEERKKDQSGNFKTGFDLIKVHLLMQRERKMVDAGKAVDRKREFVQKEIENDLDGLLTYMMSEKETWDASLPRDIYHYINGDTVELKSMALTLLLGQWHQFGDQNFGLRRVRGLPYKKRIVPGASERIFLDKLQNIDRPDYWTGEVQRYEKDQIARTMSYYNEHQQYKKKARSSSANRIG